MHSTFMSFLSIQVIFELKTGTQQNINTFSKTQKQHTIATFAISSISSFTCTSVRPVSVTTDSIDVTAMRVGRALVHVYYKIHKKNLFTLHVRVSFLSTQVIIQLKTETQQNINTFSKTDKQIKQTIATFAISSIASFTCASVRPASVTTYSIDITTMRVGRALVHVYYKIHKEILV